MNFEWYNLYNMVKMAVKIFKWYLINGIWMILYGSKSVNHQKYRFSPKNRGFFQLFQGRGEKLGYDEWSHIFRGFKGRPKPWFIWGLVVRNVVMFRFCRNGAKLGYNFQKSNMAYFKVSPI